METLEVLERQVGNVDGISSGVHPVGVIREYGLSGKRGAICWTSKAMHGWHAWVQGNGYTTPKQSVFTVFFHIYFFCFQKSERPSHDASAAHFYGISRADTGGERRATRKALHRHREAKGALGSAAACVRAESLVSTKTAEVVFGNVQRHILTHRRRGKNI